MDVRVGGGESSIRALLAAVEQPEKPQLPLVRTLRDRGLISVDLFKQLEGEIQRSQGQADAILEHVTAGGDINPEQAMKLLIAALKGGNYSRCLPTAYADEAGARAGLKDYGFRHADELTTDDLPRLGFPQHETK